MSLPKFVLPPLPTTLLVDLDSLYPAGNRYRVFAEKIYPVLVEVRDLLEQAGVYCLDNGRPGIEPIWLLGAGLLQFIERVPDRQAAELVNGHTGWNLALRRSMGERAFERSVLSCFRERLLAHKQSRVIFDQVLEALEQAGLMKRRSKQRLDSTQMWGLVREMSWLDGMRAGLHLALEELERQASLVRPAFWPELWQEYVERKPDYKASKEVLHRQLEQTGVDAARLLQWVEGLAEEAVAQGPAVQLLKRMWAEHFEVSGEKGELRHRDQLEADHVYNPHEPETRYAAKGKGQQKREHVGYKVQIAETVSQQELAPGEPTREFLTGIVTQPAHQSDEAGAEQMAEQQASRGWEPPPVQYVDGAYISAEELARAQAQGRQLIGPAQTPPRLSGGRWTVEAFQIDVEHRRAVCPAGHLHTQSSRMQASQSGKVKYRFEWTTHCTHCPLRAQCLEPDQPHRRLEVGEHHSLLQARRREQKTESFQKECHQRNGIEGTISELKRGHGLGQARYRGWAKVSLQNYFIGAACNVKRWINRIQWDLKQGLSPALEAVPNG